MIPLRENSQNTINFMNNQIYYLTSRYTDNLLKPKTNSCHGIKLC